MNDFQVRTWMIYGPLADYNDDDAREFYATWEDFLTQWDYKVINPIAPTFARYEEDSKALIARRDCTLMTSMCDGLILLPGWDEDSDATNRLYLAFMIGIPVIEATSFKPIAANLKVTGEIGTY